MTTRTPVDLAELERPALEAELSARGHRRFHAAQIVRWIYRRGVVDPSAMTDLSHELRQALQNDFVVSTPTLIHREKSVDGTDARSSRCSSPTRRR